MSAFVTEQEDIFAPETSGRTPAPYVIAREPQFDGELPTLTPQDRQSVPTDMATDAMPIRKPNAVYRIKSSHDKRVFHLLQLWEGKVIRIEGDIFEAILMDKTKPDNPEEQVVIERVEIDEDDHALLRPGAIFYWSIGYEEGPGRPRCRVSQIRLRRLPGWTKQELEEAKSKAEHLAALFA